MKTPRKIDISLLDENLKNLIEAGAKIFPVLTFEDLPTTKEQEYYRVTSGEHRNEVYTWDNALSKYVIIGADDREIDWGQILNKPEGFVFEGHQHLKEDISDFAHTHTEVEISDLDKYTKGEVDAIAAAKVDKITGKGLSEEDFTNDHRLKLESLSDTANVDYETMYNDLQYHKTGTDHDTRYYTEAEIDGKMANKADVVVVNSKLDKTTFNAHDGDTVKHITQIEKEALHDHTNKTVLDNIGDTGGTLVYNGEEISDGKSLEFHWNGTQLGIRIEGETTYQYVNLKGEKGDRGIQGIQGLPGLDGIDGKNLEFNWNGTQLGIRQEGQTSYTYVDLKGTKGDTGNTGATGKSVEFNWNGTSLGVRQEGQSQYQYVNLKGDKGDKGVGVASVSDVSETLFTVNLTNNTSHSITKAPSYNYSLNVTTQYEDESQLPAISDLGNTVLVGSNLYIYILNGWYNAGNITTVDYDIFINIDGGLFTDVDGGVDIGTDSMAALEEHIVDPSTHKNIIIDGN